jgi:hypothetical protein
VIRETVRLWRRHHLGYDQTKYVVEQVRRRIGLAAPTTRPRTVDRLDRAEVQRLIDHAYRDGSRRGLLIKTLFLTGARVSEFVHIRVEDLRPDSDPPQVHLTHAKGQANRYVPILPALAQELRTHLHGRRQGYLFESNRHTRYAVRTVQTIVKRCAAAFHPDGRRLATAGRDRAVWIWDLATGQEVARLQGHTSYVWSLAFSPDGASLASGSGDFTVRLWDTAPLKTRYQARREAEALRPEAERLVEQLWRKQHDPAEVVAALQSDRTLSEPLRQAALRAALWRASLPESGK